MIGTSVGSYHITEKLAEGGMGAVFVARHEVMGRDAVVKLLLPELSHNEEMVRRFFNEARAAAAINDPGIVQVFDVGYLQDRRAYIVMERLRGETLASRLRTRGVSVDQTVQILRLLARTLDAAHAHGIVHRDLKPDNIFLVLDRDVAGGERTKILDFGIAKLAGVGATHATRAGSIFGTPAYMAPEQCSDAATVDARADLYAIGCIAYEMLCGQPPFGLGGLELLASHLRDEVVPLRQRNPNIPLWVEEVVHRLLRKSPAERYQTSSELFGALDVSRHTPSPGTAATINPPPMIAAAPHSYPLSSRPAITTHAAAAGAMSTAPAAPRSKLPYAFAAVAVVAIAIVVAVAAGRGAPADEPVAAKPATVVEKPQDQGNLLADAERALGEHAWSDAMIAAAKIPSDHPAYARGQEIIKQAKEGQAQALVAMKQTADDANANAQKLIGDAKVKPPTKQDRVKALQKQITAGAKPTDTPKPPEEDQPPAMGFEDAMTQARNDLAAKHYGLALRHAQAALKTRPGELEALMIATIAACGSGKEGLAKALLPKDHGSHREIALHRCSNLGVTLD